MFWSLWKLNLLQKMIHVNMWVMTWLGIHLTAGSLLIKPFMEIKTKGLQ